MSRPPIALVVLDCQRAVVDRLAGAEQLRAAVADALATARRQAWSVVHVAVGFEEADWVAVPATNPVFSAVARNRLFAAGSPAAQIDACAVAAPGEVEVRKTRLAAFAGTALESQLRQSGTTDLVLVGAQTSGAVLATASVAADLDFAVRIVGDAVADSDEEAHRVLVERVFPRFAQVVSTADLTSLVPTS